MDIELTVKLKINNAIDQETLDLEFDGSLERYVKESLLEDESLFSVVEDDYELIDIQEIKDKIEIYSDNKE